jgi:hypothetical protein
MTCTVRVPACRQQPAPQEDCRAITLVSPTHLSNVPGALDKQAETVEREVGDGR